VEGRKVAASVQKAERLAALECANRHAGACRGIDTRSTFAVELPRCLVRMGLPCRYFERCLLPLAERRPEYAPAGNDYYRRTRGAISSRLRTIRDEDLRSAVEDHPFLGRLPRKRNAPVRRCRCGAPLGKRKRYCAECRARRRRETKKESERRRRARDSSDVDS